MFGRIPLPKFGHEVFAEGAHDILKNLMARRLKEQELEQQGEYQQGQLGLARQAETRHQQLMPYMIKQYEQKARQAEAQQDLYNRLFGNPNQQNQQMPQQGQQTPSPQQEQFGNPNQQNQQMPQQGQQTPSPQQEQLGNQPNAQMSGQNAPTNTNQRKYQQLQQDLASGQEVTIRPPQSPQKAMWDQAPGTTVMGIKIPDIRSTTVDGIRYDTYPSGKVIAQKVGPNAEEKAQIQINTASAKEEGKINAKRSKDLIETGHMLNEYGQHVEALSKLYEKKKNVSGLKQGLLNKIYLGSPEAAIFQEHATPLVGKLAKDISQRGGAVAAGMAQAGKPNLYQPNKYNIAMIQEHEKQVYNTYKRAKEEYEELNPGKKYPIKLSKFFSKVKVQSPRGHIAIKTPEEAEELIKKYPGSQIIGNGYE